MTTLLLHVTEVQFDFDDEDFTLEEQQSVVDSVLGNTYQVEVDNENDDGEVELLMNQKKVNVKISTPLDELLHSMGLDNALEVKISHLASPMPGLVIKSLVKAGDTVEKGDPLIVLEAMKMENVLKAPSALTIEKVNVTNGQAVEKGAVLIQFA